MNNEKLKSCPFCGGEAELQEIGNNHTKSRSVIIKCKSCRVQIKNSALKKGMDWLIDTSIKSWNTRI